MKDEEKEKDRIANVVKAWREGGEHDRCSLP